jgi:ribosomal protein S1
MVVLAKGGICLMVKKQNKNLNTKYKQGGSNPMERLLQERSVSPVKKGEEIDAKIVQLDRKNVLFDIGAKAYAVLGNKEQSEISTYLPYIKVGDSIPVKVISEESRDGYPVVSMQKFFDKGKWSILEDKKNNEEDIEVICGDYGKGGVFIDFMGIRGVIPKIQLLPEYMDEHDKLSGQKVKVKVLEVEEAKNRLVVSQKAAVLGISQKDLKAKFDSIQVGDNHTAKVLGVSEFGIFCEVDGVEGLVHISEISWEKVTDASNFVRPGDTIGVVVSEKNEADLKLNLSIKRLSNDPWSDIEERYPKDKEIDGTVVRKERYGYFVRIEPGIEGLIHISKLKGDEGIKVGDKIKVFVERINTKDRKMSLVLPQKEKPLLYR